MDSIDQKLKVNPLISLMRQPKIYIKLPSQGKFWPEGALDISPNGEYAVFSMTARDELLLKTPDSLLNGQAIVDVIQNCIPAIHNAWEIPNIDLDVILVALRLATYGTQMEMTIGKDELTYSVDLRTILDSLYETVTWDEQINFGDSLAIFVKPVNYKVISQANQQNFETQKIMNLLNNSVLTEEQKISAFRDSLKKLTDLTVGIINNSVYRIESSAGTTDDPEFIKEFMNNCDKDIYDAVKNRLDEMRTKNAIKPMLIDATPEMIAAGSPEIIEVPITFDQTNFFV
jgi:hypothetical protein